MKRCKCYGIQLIPKFGGILREYLRSQMARLINLTSMEQEYSPTVMDGTGDVYLTTKPFPGPTGAGRTLTHDGRKSSPDRHSEIIVFEAPLGQDSHERPSASKEVQATLNPCSAGTLYCCACQSRDNEMQISPRHDFERRAAPSGNLLLDCCTKSIALALFDKEHIITISLWHGVGHVAKTAYLNGSVLFDKAIVLMNCLRA